MELAFFLLFAATAVASALSLILQRNPIYSALSLIVVIGSIGGLYLLLNAGFLAVLQIVIYAGAVMALFLFVIMMLDVTEERDHRWPSRTKIVLLILLLIAGASAWAVSSSFTSFPALAENFEVRTLSTQLFTTYLLPFEAISVLIVSSVIGALYIARQEDR